MQAEGGFALLQVKQKEARSGVKAEKELAPVLDNSLAWGGFLAVSSNSRYQIVGTLEERILVRLMLDAQYLTVVPRNSMCGITDQSALLFWSKCWGLSCAGCSDYQRGTPHRLGIPAAVCKHLCRRGTMGVVCACHRFAIECIGKVWRCRGGWGVLLYNSASMS